MLRSSLDLAQRSAAIEIEGFKLARSEADGRITELSNLVADLQREILNEKVKANDEKHLSSGGTGSAGSRSRPAVAGL